MTSNSTRTPTFGRMMAAAAVAVGINAAMVGGLLATPTRGETLLASNPVAMPMVVGSVTLLSIKAGAMTSMAHAARDLRHAERNVLRGLHHSAKAVGATLGFLTTPAHPAC